MNEDRCICCGEIIPEGRMVCPNCLVTVKEGEDNGQADNGLHSS
jgi:RNA polymerase subunit RPABC4/transcription elongation factor Spt4